MKVKEIMTQSAVCCNPETNVGAAVELMWVRNCGMLPVVFRLCDDGSVQNTVSIYRLVKGVRSIISFHRQSQGRA